MDWTLNNILERINDGAMIKIFRYEDGCEIGAYEDKSDVPDELGYYEVTDMFPENNYQCIEIETGEEGNEYDY